jgi:hypothetical protein
LDRILEEVRSQRRLACEQARQRAEAERRREEAEARREEMHRLFSAASASAAKLELFGAHLEYFSMQFVTECPLPSPARIRGDGCGARLVCAAGGLAFASKAICKPQSRFAITSYFLT